jgi:hypothetical protein
MLAMSLYIFLFSLPLTVVAVLFEAYPRFINRLCGVDIWTHLLYLEEYHKQGGIPKRIDEGFLVPGVYDYPPTFIYLLSKFPLEVVERYEFLFSPIFDAIHLILMFIITYSFTNNIFIALLVQAFYLLTPIIILENSSATPRSIGYTLFTIVFLSLFLFESNGQLPYLILAIISGSLIFLSHRFTTQSYLFFSLFFSVIRLNGIYILVFCFSALLAIVLSRGFYLKVFQGHIGNLRFWKDNIENRFAHQIKGNYKQHKTDDFVFRLYNQFLRFPPFVLAITNPWVLFAFFGLYFMHPLSPMVARLSEIVIFSYVLALVTTWIPQLRFLGEGQRYLELSAFPAAYLSAILFSRLFTSYPLLTLTFYTVVGIMSLLTIIVIQRKAIIHDKLRTLTPELMSMFSYLKGLKNKPRLLCIPHQITTNTIFHTGCPVFVNADYSHIEKIADVFPYMKKPIKQIMKKYDLDAVLLNENYASLDDLRLKKYTIVKRFGNYILLKI